MICHVWFFLKKAKPAAQTEPQYQAPIGPVLKILDECAKNFTFPMLDNGYHYLATSRLTAFHGESGWGLVFEIFDFSPRAGFPGLTIQTYASAPFNRKTPNDYVSHAAWEKYLVNNPNNEFKTFWNIENQDWLDEEVCEYLKPKGLVILRDQKIELPETNEYASAGIELEEDRPMTFELCRFLAAHYREDVLGTETERRHNISDDLQPILTLEDWIHIDLANEEMPSQSETFRQIEQVLLSGDPSHYTMKDTGDTHWSNWPKGGAL